MANRRVQVDPGIQPVAPRAVAAPVDTFVRPVDGQKLAQLSQALGQVSPSVGRFARVVGEQADASAKNEGELAGIAAADKIKADGTTLAEATRKGILPASRNPFYMAGLKEQLGRAMADKYDGDLASYVSQHEGLQESTDLKDFDKVAADFKTKWKEQNIGSGNKADEFFDTGFGFRADAYEQRSRQEFARGIEEKVLKQGNEATHQETVQAIQDGVRQNHLDAVPASINQMVDDLQKQGRNPAVVLRSVAQAVHDAALADPDNSDKILNLLSGIKGKNGPLSTTSYGMALADKVKVDVSERKQLEYSRNAAHAAAVKTAGVENVYQQFNDAMEKAGLDGHNVDVRPFREAMNKIAPEHVGTLDAMQDAFVNHEYKEDPHIADDLLVRVHTVSPGSSGFVDVAVASHAFAAHTISKETYKTLVSEIQQRDKAGAEKSVTNDKWFTEGMSRVYKAFANELGDEQVNRLRAEGAQTEFAARYIREFGGKVGHEYDAAKNAFIENHIAHEFTDKGTNAERSTFGKVPKPQMEGPAKADPEKVMVIDRSTQTSLQSELSEMVQHKRSVLSAPLARVLATYGIKPNIADIQKFIYKQKALYDSGQRHSVAQP